MRVHSITDDLLPALDAGTGSEGAWERVVERLTEVTLRHRRLIELHLRNQEAVSQLHMESNLPKHGPVRSELEEHVLGMLNDPSVSIEDRIRRIASLGAVAGVLLGASAFGDVPDSELEAVLRRVTRDVLRLPRDSEEEAQAPVATRPSGPQPGKSA
jgi:hypothetical protein